MGQWWNLGLEIKYFTAAALDFPQNQVGQANLAHTLTTALRIACILIFTDCHQVIQKAFVISNSIYFNVILRGYWMSL